MTRHIQIDVPMVPVGEGRARVDGRSGRVYTPEKTRHARKLIADVARLTMAREPGPWPMTSLAWVRIVATMPRHKQRPDDVPVSVWRRGEAYAHRGKPDVDNIAKLALDAIVAAGVLGDDTQVYHLVVERHHAGTTDAPGLLIELWGGEE